MATTFPVTRSALRQIKPIVAPVWMPMLPTRVWTDAEWDRIQLGHEARGLDDKWNVFVEDGLAYLHRSCTGHGIFEAYFVGVPGGGQRIVRAMVESDPSRYRSGSDEYDCVTLEQVISAVVLGEPWG